MGSIKRGLKYIFYIVVVILLSFGHNIVWAETSSSTNYSIEESTFSSGSEIDSNSSNYNSRISAGNLGVGISESGSYIGQVGFITPDEEYVELVVPVTTINMGVLTPGTPGTGTATFTARAYLNDNYVVYTLKGPPTNENGDVISPITTAAAFDSAVEQFGINLVANTSPVTQGAAPSRQPVDNGEFAFGEASPGYNTTNLYQYNDGDSIARSVSKGFGETDYTISYILNITSTTPAGLYTMQQNLVITATY